MKDGWVVDCEHSKKMYLAEFERQWQEHKHLTMTMKTGKQATSKQLRSMHLFIRQVVAELRERGITITQFFNDGFELPWTEEIFKDECWKPLQKALMESNKKKSTKDQTRDIPGRVHELLNEKFSNWGFYVNWPEKKDK